MVTILSVLKLHICNICNICVDLFEFFVVHHHIASYLAFSLRQEAVCNLYLSKSLLFLFLYACYAFCVVKHVLWHDEVVLAHFFEEVTRDLDCDIGGQVLVALILLAEELVPDPLRHLVSEILALVSFVCEYHHSIVVLGAQNSANTL